MDGRPRRHYRLSRAGDTTLSEETDRLRETSAGTRLAIPTWPTRARL